MLRQCNLPRHSDTYCGSLTQRMNLLAEFLKLLTYFMDTKGIDGMFCIHAARDVIWYRIVRGCRVIALMVRMGIELACNEWFRKIFHLQARSRLFNIIMFPTIDRGRLPA